MFLGSIDKMSIGVINSLWTVFNIFLRIIVIAVIAFLIKRVRNKFR